jgi:hypothetical protein
MHLEMRRKHVKTGRTHHHRHVGHFAAIGAMRGEELSIYAAFLGKWCRRTVLISRIFLILGILKPLFLVFFHLLRLFSRWFSLVEDVTTYVLLWKQILLHLYKNATDFFF